jgi:glycosyltransferase involved in cell wall biosynthesis
MGDLQDQGDILVSTSSEDGTSVSLLEAMGLGAFPIVMDIHSNREWITPSLKGFLVPVNEEKLPAKRMIDAIRDKA